MKRLARIILTLACALAVLALTLSATLLWRPQWLLTSRTVGWIARAAGRAYHPSWTRLAFEIDSPNWRDKRIALSVSGLCLRDAARKFDGCFREIDAGVTLRLRAFGVSVTEVSRLAVSADALRIDTTRRKPKPAGARRSPPRIPPLRELDIALPSVIVETPGGTVRGRLELARQRGGPLTLEARASRWTETGLQAAQASAVVDSKSFDSRTFEAIDARGTIAAKGATADARLKTHRVGTDIAMNVSVRARRGPYAATLNARGVRTPRHVGFEGSLAAESSTGPVRNLTLSSFTLEADGAFPGSMPTKLRMRSPFKVELSEALVRSARHRGRAGALPVPLSLSGQLAFDASGGGGSPREFDALLTLALSPYRDWYELGGGVRLRLRGNAGEFAKTTLEHDVSLALSVPRFERAVAALRDTALAIPAPFNELTGPVRASLSTSGDPRAKHQSVSYRVSTDLRGERQRLKASLAGRILARGAFTPSRAVEIAADARLEDVALSLPRLTVTRMPPYRADPRIRRGRAKAASPERASPAKDPRRLSARLRVSTDMPLRLLTDLADAPVPIRADLQVRYPDASAAGEIEVLPFPFQVFRRTATLERLKLIPLPTGKFGVDGLILYRTPEALIRIMLLGTSAKTRVEFESDPPMEKEEIVALLLYGKPPGSLDDEEASTVANAQTAVSNKAFGLASLYLFASTPIEYIGYNPTTRAYTLRFRLPGGEALSLNSDFDQTRQIQLRKRLSAHFAVQAEASTTQDARNDVATFLEWFQRY
ncbi:MAG: translocation/assembly module TamB domain-containing protein [Elusimicrobia bacterium]|nr:translocation/assembly module TamB domain-containing protein [Elusimicrobiota bacterium]